MSKVRAYTPWLVLVLLMSGIVLTTVFIAPVKRVTSHSMEPELSVGSFIFIREQPSYRRGDIIVFPNSDGKTITHRLVDYGEGTSLITKGDANPTPDIHERPLTEDDVIGKVVLKTIPIASADFWLKPRGLALIACLLVIVVALSWRTDSVKPEATKK